MSGSARKSQWVLPVAAIASLQVISSCGGGGGGAALFEEKQSEVVPLRIEEHSLNIVYDLEDYTGINSDGESESSIRYFSTLNDLRGAPMSEVLGFDDVDISSNMELARRGSLPHGFEGDVTAHSSSWYGVRVNNVHRDQVGVDETSLAEGNYPIGTRVAGTFTLQGLNVGDLRCLGTDCRVVSGTLTGGWYLIANEEAINDNIRYRNDGDDTNPDWVKTRFTPYVRYGYWVSLDNDILTYSQHFLSEYPFGSGVKNEFTVTAGGSATFNGKATGVAIQKGNVEVIGGFTADVALTATFGGTPAVSGTISSFVHDGQGDDSVSTLPDITLPSANINRETGKFGTKSSDTLWTGAFYGRNANARPRGAHGGFEYNTDTHTAAGAFAVKR